MPRREHSCVRNVKNRAFVKTLAALVIIVLTIPGWLRLKGEQLSRILCSRPRPKPKISKSNNDTLPLTGVGATDCRTLRTRGPRPRTLILLKQANSANKKFELVLTKRAKAYSCQSISSHFVAVHSRSVRYSRRSQKSIKTPYFGRFIAIDVDTTKKLVASVCCDMQYAHAYLQPFSRETGQQR